MCWFIRSNRNHKFSSILLFQKSEAVAFSIESLYSLDKTMANKDESDTVEFIEEWALVMEGERTLSSQFTNININHDVCIRSKVLIFIHPFPQYHQ